ncbi:MAG: hypothetical protein Tp158DCM1229571_4 [Prokaryotic dsDNA virus sp.]|nr:MAG: hypothetical protein Tp158DCM1229571_4 [Prokaryotic dsDNA virus sp.]|tara:strand:+ start:87 stop:635 length:549 start_codon:yes stop_codon:yes gene_type:complete
MALSEAFNLAGNYGELLKDFNPLGETFKSLSTGVEAADNQNLTDLYFASEETKTKPNPLDPADKPKPNLAGTGSFADMIRVLGDIEKEKSDRMFDRLPELLDYKMKLARYMQQIGKESVEVAYQNRFAYDKAPQMVIDALAKRNTFLPEIVASPFQYTGGARALTGGMNARAARSAYPTRLT